MYLCITGLFTGYMTLVYNGYLKICWQIFIIYLMFKCNNEKRPSNKRISKPFMRSNDDQLANKMLTWINVLPFRIHKLVLSLRLLIKFTFLLILPEITPFYVLYLQTNKSYSARLVLWQEPPRCLSFTLDYIMDVLVSSMYPRSNQTFATKLKFWRDISVITKLQGNFWHYILTRTLNFLGNRSKFNAYAHFVLLLWRHSCDDHFREDPKTSRTRSTSVSASIKVTSLRKKGDCFV